MGDGPGNFSVGDVAHFDGSSVSQPSDAVQGLLELMSLTLALRGKSNSVFPFTACDIGVAKDEAQWKCFRLVWAQVRNVRRGLILPKISLRRLRVSKRVVLSMMHDNFIMKTGMVDAVPLIEWLLGW